VVRGAEAVASRALSFRDANTVVQIDIIADAERLRQMDVTFLDRSA